MNFIFGISKRHIPLFSISTLLRKKQFIFNPFGGIFRKGLSRFNHFYVQNESTKLLLSKIGIQQVTVSGDTRYDHVLHQQKNTLEKIANQAIQKQAISISDEILKLKELQNQGILTSRNGQSEWSHVIEDALSNDRFLQFPAASS